MTLAAVEGISNMAREVPVLAREEEEEEDFGGSVWRERVMLLPGGAALAF